MSGPRPSLEWVRQQDLMDTRPAGSDWPGMCREYLMNACPVFASVHLCDRAPGHRGVHHCPCCNQQWGRR